MNKTLKVYLVLEKRTEHLYRFITEFTNLIENESSFIIGWKAGDRIYLYVSGSGQKRNAFACLNPKDIADNKNAVSTLNYAISVHCKFDIDIIGNNLIFTISHDAKIINLIQKFKDGLFNC